MIHRQKTKKVKVLKEIDEAILSVESKVLAKSLTTGVEISSDVPVQLQC